MISAACSWQSDLEVVGAEHLFNGDTIKTPNTWAEGPKEGKQLFH